MPNRDNEAVLKIEKISFVHLKSRFKRAVAKSSQSGHQGEMDMESVSTEYAHENWTQKMGQIISKGHWFGT